MPAELAKTETGRAFLAKFDDFLFEFGWRSDAVYDMADVTWREEPSIPLMAVASYLNLDDSEDPKAHFVRSTETRERLMAGIRAKVKGNAELEEKLERFYGAASYNLPLTEDHAFWIDQSGIAVFRRFVMEIGNRLAAKGVIAAADDVHYLYVAELRDGVTNGTNYKTVAAERRADMAAVGEGNSAPGARYAASTGRRSVYGRGCRSSPWYSSAGRRGRPNAHRGHSWFRWCDHRCCAASYDRSKKLRKLTMATSWCAK